jgi:hypothetical protein
MQESRSAKAATNLFRMKLAFWSNSAIVFNFFPLIFDDTGVRRDGLRQCRARPAFRSASQPVFILLLLDFERLASVSPVV